MIRQHEVEPGFDKEVRREEFEKKAKNSNRHEDNMTPDKLRPVNPKRYHIEEDWEDELDWEDDFKDITNIWDSRDDEIDWEDDFG